MLPQQEACMCSQASPVAAAQPLAPRRRRPRPLSSVIAAGTLLLAVAQPQPVSGFALPPMMKSSSSRRSRPAAAARQSLQPILQQEQLAPSAPPSALTLSGEGETLDAAVIAMAQDPENEMDSQQERDFYSAMREQKRIHAKQELLESILGRSASVAEWASAAGYCDSMAMLAALRAGAKAERELLKSQGAMVMYFARKYAAITTSLTRKDLVQEGNIGLLSAVESFDADKGVRFSNYASVLVRSHILRAVAQKDRTMRVPVGVQDTAFRIKSMASKLAVTLGREPTDAELARGLDMTVAAVQQQRTAVARQKVQSGDTSTADAYGTAAAADSWGQSELQLDLQRVMDLCLQPNEIHILQLRFGLNARGKGPLTFKEIGASMQTSAEGIRKMVIRAVNKLHDNSDAFGLLGDYAEYA
jgi:RNA polymerase primary sigma factor